MKISKIASLAILGISLSTSAFAAALPSTNTADDAVKKLKAEQDAREVFLKNLDIVSASGNRAKLEKIATTPDQTIEAAFKDVSNIAEATMKLLATGAETIISEFTGGGKTAKLKISKNGQKPKLELSVKDSGEEYKVILNDNGIVKTDMRTLFAEGNEAALRGLVGEVKKNIKAKITEQETAVYNANKTLVEKLVEEGTTVGDNDVAYLANNEKYLMEAFEKNYESSDAKEKAKKLKIYATNLVKTTNLAQKAEVKLKEEVTAQKTHLKTPTIDNMDADTIKGITSEITNPTLDKLKQRANAIKAEFKKVTDLKAEAKTANDMSGDEAAKKQAQFNVIKKAVELGIKFDSKSSSGTAITSTNVNNYEPNNGSAKEDFGTAFEQAKAKIEAEVADSGNTLGAYNKKAEEALKKFSELETTYNNAKSVKASLISDYLIAGVDNKALAKALSGAVSNKAISEMLTDLDLDKTEKAIESLATSVREVSDVIANNSVIDGVSFANNLATATRLAKLSNPFNDDLALAYAIKNIKNDSFADNSGDLVNSTIKAYTDRYNNDNNVWGTLIGAKGHIKNAGNPEFYGLSLGYDKRLDNTILGGFVSYAKSKLDTKLVSSEANNYQLGAYSRTFIDNHEIDAKASFALAKNSLDRTSETTSSAKPKFLKQNANFDSYLFNLKADYGYVVGIDDTLFLKPTVGLEYSYAKNKEFKESGDIAFNYHGYNSSTLALNAALEIRQYVNNSNFLYFTPGVSTQLYKSNKDLVLNVVGSNVDVTLPVNSSKQTFFTLNTGADIKLTDALSTNINFGVKASSKEQYYNGTLGLKYQF